MGKLRLREADSLKPAARTWRAGIHRRTELVVREMNQRLPWPKCRFGQEALLPHLVATGSMTAPCTAVGRGGPSQVLPLPPLG